MFRKLMYSLLPFALVFALVLYLLPRTVTAATFFGPTPYLSFAADSPFAGGLFNYFHNEDFEDGLLNTPGLSISAGAGISVQAIPGTFQDSVAEDFAGDGMGGSVTVGATVTGLPVVISFDQGALGALPTHAGLVVVDLQLSVSPFDFTHDVTVDFFGPGNVLLGSVTDPTFGTSFTTGQTDEDRGFFATDVGGIERMEVRSTQPVVLELDHIQYGLVPEPSSLVLCAIGTLGMCAYGWRRRRGA